MQDCNWIIEAKMSKTKLAVNCEIYKNKKNGYNPFFNSRKTEILKNIIQHNKNNPKAMFKAFDTTLHRTKM